MNIENWADVPDGATIIEDTYNEVYTILTKDGKRYLRQIGWQVPDKRKINDGLREIDFEPNCIYDQPWYRID
jgi:hypothetical protein